MRTFTITPPVFWVFMLLLLSLGLWGVTHLPEDGFSKSQQPFYFALVIISTLVITNLYSLIAATRTAKYFAAAMTEDLAAATSLFQDLYSKSPVPYARIKKNGEIISTNTAMIRFFKVTEGRLDTLNLFDLFSVENDVHASLLKTQISRGQFVNDEEVSLQDSDGAVHWALLSSFPYGNTNERLVTLFDITKQKRVDIAKSEFLSLASHQLRTPISAMQWNLELFESAGELSEKQLVYLRKIERNTEKMNVIIKDFLDASQLEMGTFATEVVEVELHTFLDQIYEEFQVRIDTKELTLNKDYSQDPATIHTDEHLLHNVVSNLVSNAVKYTPKSGNVSVAYRMVDQHIVFMITDSGMGIPKSEQAQLFSKFFRASNAKSTVTEGTGLGLYIVAQAVEKLGGTIGITSAADEGSTFTVTIPRKLNLK